jgi:hypothetical protein
MSATAPETYVVTLRGMHFGILDYAVLARL